MMSYSALKLSTLLEVWDQGKAEGGIKTYYYH